MNDHRTFLPYIGLVIAMAGRGVVLDRSRRSATAYGAKAAGDLRGRTLSVRKRLCHFQRNKVWKTEETLWRDVTIKSPATRTWVDELRQHPDGERRFQRRARLLSSRARR